MYWEHFLRDICIHIYTYRTSLHDHTNDRSQHGLSSDRHDERMWYVVVRRLSHMWSAMRWRATPLACFLHTLHPPPNSQTCRTPGIHTYAYVCIYNNVALPLLRGPHSSFCCHYYCVSHPAMCSMMSESLTKSMTTSTLKQTFPKAGNQGEPKQWGSPSCARARSLLAPSSVPASPTRLKSTNCCYGLQVPSFWTRRHHAPLRTAACCICIDWRPRRYGSFFLPFFVFRRIPLHISHTYVRAVLLYSFLVLHFARVIVFSPFSGVVIIVGVFLFSH